MAAGVAAASHPSPATTLKVAREGAAPLTVAFLFLAKEKLMVVMVTALAMGLTAAAGVPASTPSLVRMAETHAETEN
jgi:hypothetical protein